MIQPYHVVNALPPTADAFAGTVTTDVISMRSWNHCTFIIQYGEGDTGQSVITMEACNDITPSHTEAIPFGYRECMSGDTFGAMEKVEASGFTTKAGSNKMVRIEVTSRTLPEDKPYVRLKAVESADGPVNGGVVAILSNPRYGGDAPDTVLAL